MSKESFNDTSGAKPNLGAPTLIGAEHPSREDCSQLASSVTDNVDMNGVTANFIDYSVHSRYDLAVLPKFQIRDFVGNCTDLRKVTQ